MKTIDEIRKNIMDDQDNKEFSNKGYIPIFMANEHAKILIIGQAPGIKTQLIGEPFHDKSGDKLRQWLDIDEATFYHSNKIAILPLDFYFPGKAKQGDKHPRLDFAKKWHPQLLALMPNIKLTILMGLDAQKFYLKDKFKGSLTETVLSYKEYLPTYFPIVHSSPLNFRWFKKHPEFESDIVPELYKLTHEILKK